MIATRTPETPVQRSGKIIQELPGQSLNAMAQCDPFDGDRTPLNVEWITEELLARTRDVWGRYLGRNVSKEEAMDMVMNVRRIASAFLFERGDE